MKRKRTYSIINKLAVAALVFNSVFTTLPVFGARTDAVTLQEAACTVSGNEAGGEETGAEAASPKEAGAETVSPKESGAEEYALKDSGTQSEEAESVEAFSPDGWEAMSDEELTDYFFHADEQKLAEWLVSLPYDSFTRLIARDTWLLEETLVQTFGNAFYSEEEGGIVGELTEEKTMPFYEKVLEENGYAVPTENAIPAEKVSYFANSKGEYYYKTYNNGMPGQNVTVTMSGLSTDVSISDTDSFEKLKVTVSSTGTTAYGGIAVTVPVSSSAKASQYGYLLSTLSTIGAGSSDSRVVLTANIALQKKAGYRIAYTKSTSSGIFKCVSGSNYKDAEYAGDNNAAKETTAKLTSFTSITENSSVGKKGNSSAQNVGQTYSFNFIPSSYTVKYNANGAKNGLAPSDQICQYGSVYQTASIGTLDNYFTISYDLNYEGGGTVPETHAKRTFLGWECGGSVYASNQNFSNLAADGSVTMSAKWSPYGEPVQLAVPQAMPYHKFLGWATTRTAAAPNIKMNGYLPERDMKLYAIWSVNSIAYRVNHYIRTAEGGEWELFQSEDYIGDEGTVVTMKFDSRAIEKVNAVPHYKCRLPQSITKSLTAGMGAIDYYYDIEKDLDDPYWLEKDGGTNVTGCNVYISAYGTEYKIVKNNDGTYSICGVQSDSRTVVTIPSRIKLGDREVSVTEIEDGALKDNGTVKQVIISNGIVSIGDYAFYHCTALEKVEMPDSVIKIGKYAFAKCQKLSAVKFSKGCRMMGDGAFLSDTALTKISLKSKLSVVPKKAFYNCTALKKLTLPASVTAIRTSAFEGCGSLQKVTIPKKVTAIDKKAFYNCKSLKSVKLKTTVLKKAGTKAFYKCMEGIRFHVPAKRLESYKKLLKGTY